MLLKLYLSKTSNLFEENRLLKFVILVLAGMQLYFFYEVKTQIALQKVVVVPTGLSQRFEIQGNHFSDHYFRQMTRYISTLAFNYTPSGARKQFEELLGLYSAEVYSKAESSFYELADTIEMAHISSRFYPDLEQTTLDIENQHILLSGHLIQYANDQKIEDRTMEYTIEYELSLAGEFRIIAMYTGEES